ncbi:MAG: flagellar hook-associated protein FlgL [Lachnospiraceae bacterium]|nr:flagellar hook-associated protein FlgL [Lachnospiraceae bacterium]
MTNKIMQRNSLYNINQTKISEDKYNTQLTSQSKITRPSDDPVIAIRALRLRSNVSTANQYYDKNAPDANQWLDVTAKSLDTITKVYTDLYKQVETGVNKDYTASDMNVLLTQIESYTNEVFATGNQDYAGRYIFTGYRTDTPLTFQKEQIDKTKQEPIYKITENLKEAQLDSFSYTDYTIFDTKANALTADELDITNVEINRLRLSYKDVDASVDPTFKILDKDGTDITNTIFSAGLITTAPSAEYAYGKMITDTANGTSSAYFIPTTGEIIFTSDIADKLSTVFTDGGSVSVDYQKRNWEIGDLNPQHYFECTYVDTTDPSGNSDITYNKGGNVNTEIVYDVGYNQTIQVNTNAYEVFDPAVQRDLDDLKDIVNQFTEIEKIRNDLKEELKGYVEGTSAYTDCKKRLDAADKAFTYIRDAVSKRFGDQITRYQNYLDSTNVAITKNGTRSTRLELISARLEEQKSTFKELQEENEGIDMTEVAVLLTAAETTYDAALMATSKIMQNSLINYI